MSVRANTMYLGTCIGTNAGWDQAGSFDVVFINYQPDELGKKFLKTAEWGIELPESLDLSIDCETGKVQINWDKGLSELDLTAKVDWSVFNKHEG